MKSAVRHILLVAILLPFWQSVMAAQTVGLVDHPSLYLRMHADDPVEWRGWGKPVLEAAQASNRLIYLSIGYFSCHWCHVMQRESFKDVEVSQYLNQHFIPVKIDRELRPELDRRMLEFVRSIEGRAGWPLNVFLTPEGYPLTGFPYQSRDEFLHSLAALTEQWNQRHIKLKRTARLAFEKSSSPSDQAGSVSEVIDSLELVRLLESDLMHRADDLQGGFGETSKFPAYPQLSSLIALLETGAIINEDAEAFAQLTLDNMLSLNLHDQVNGGFFRYVTDPDWQIPHYEKMLYDNAQMILLFLQAHAIWPDRDYDDVALATLEFVNRELLDPRGGYFSSLSAVDVNDVDGGGYLWSRKDLLSALSADDLHALQRTASFALPENDPVQVTGLFQLSADTRQSIQEKLRNYGRPVMPADNKKLASWNALMLMALVEMEKYRRNEGIRDLTDRQYHFVRNNFIHEGLVSRFSGYADFAESTLEDYAFIARALADYGRLRESPEVQTLARQLIEETFARYYQEGRWSRSDNELIPVDRGEWILSDGTLESPVTLLLETALMLGTESTETSRVAKSLATRMTMELRNAPFHYASAIRLIQQHISAEPKSGRLNSSIGQ